MIVKLCKWSKGVNECLKCVSRSSKHRTCQDHTRTYFIGMHYSFRLLVMNENKTQKQIVLVKWVKYFDKVTTQVVITFLDFHLWNGIATINYAKWRNHLTKQIKRENDKMIWSKLVFVFLYISSLQRWQNKFFHQNLHLRNNLFGCHELQP